VTDYPPLPKFPVSSGPEPTPWHDPRGVPPPSKTRAGWALGLTILPGVITILIGVILAIFVLVDTARERRDHGKRMAIAALCVAGAWVVAFAALGIYFATAGVDRSTDGEVLEAGRVGAGDLTVGDCLPEPPRDGKQFFVEVVPCGDPHRGEVFAVFDLPTYSPPDEQNSEVDDGCLEGYRGYFGETAPTDSTFEIYVMQPPDPRSFAGDPAVACIGFVATSVTGSLRK
jgi:hypothetical protein